MNPGTIADITRRLAEWGYEFNLQTNSPRERDGEPEFSVIVAVRCSPDHVARLLELAETFSMGPRLVEDGIQLVG